MTPAELRAYIQACTDISERICEIKDRPSDGNIEGVRETIRCTDIVEEFRNRARIELRRMEGA